MPEIAKNDEIYYYEHTGNPEHEETLVFIHGATMTGAGMLPLAEQFREYNCITVDLPGHGHSKGKSKTKIEDFADSVIYLIEELQKTGKASDKVTVLGFSMGGCITVEISLRKPSWLKRAVVLSSGADLKGNTPLIDTFNVLKPSEFHTKDLYDHLGGRYTTEEELKGELDTLLPIKCEDPIGLTDLQTACAFDKLSLVKTIAIPLLVVAGDDDEIVPVHIPIHLRDAVPNSEMLILPYRGHSALYEEVEQVVKTIKDFMKFHPIM